VDEEAIAIPRWAAEPEKIINNNTLSIPRIAILMVNP
jgi:hypothetical protein